MISSHRDDADGRVEVVLSPDGWTHAPSERALGISGEEFEILLGILSETHDVWRAVTTDFGARGKLPIAFQSVQACQPETAEALEQRIRTANATFTRL
ncbi:MAG: hypothetical protein QOG75_180 [Mycobacterium sp.]|jgi:hypothetical protein|nr:hypothetical protein [Mycobacterium sp.]